MKPRLSIFAIRDSLRGSLLAAFVLLSIVIVVAVASASIIIAVNASRDTVLDQMVSDVELNKQAINNWLNERLYNLRMIATNPYDRDNAHDILNHNGSFTTQQNLLERFHIEQNNFDEISLIDAQGRVVLTTRAANLGKNHREQPYFQEGMKGEYISRAFFSPENREHHIMISIPLSSRQGEISGVLAGRLRLEDLTGVMLSRESFSATGQVYLVNADRQFITELRFPPESNLGYSEGIDQALNNHNGTGIYTNYNATRVVGAYRWLPDLGVALLSEIHEAEALEGIRSLMISVIGITVLALVGAFFASRRITQNITRPVFALVDMAQAVTEGDLTRTTSIEKPNEIARLSRAFNTMTGRLHDLIHTLEERVDARTRDLEIAAGVSRQITTILDLHHLLQQVTALTAKSFSLYACVIFIPDKKQRYLIMQAGANSEGQPLEFEDLARVSLEARPSLIALAARTRQPALINDVSQSPDYLKISSLPETQSELTLPMMLGDELLGIFDLQSRGQNRFGDEELRILTALADQIAVAIRNAQLFAEAQKAREEAEQANRVKSMFLATMSHELRTPLNGILNFTRFVADGMLGPVTEQQVDVLQKAIASSRHLLALINDILDISKIESGSLKLFIEEDVNLNEELETVITTAQTLLKDKPVELKLDIDQNLPRMSCDKRRVRQVLLNIVSNACKFTEEGCITVTVQGLRDEILMWVKDTGPGIAPEDHAAVFQTFQQTDTGLRQGEGTGLGMPISKRLVEAHGGEMWIDSVKGAGATFYVTLPCRPKEV